MDIQLLDDTCRSLEEISDVLYQGYVSQGIARMNEVIPNLALISTWIEDAGTQERLIQDALSPILSAMEQQDGTELADLITYELLTLLGELR
ncbi:MAG: hypothetical protein ACI4L2_00055 [Wujia sp.]